MICLFVLFMIFFAVWKCLSLIRNHLFIFISITLGDRSEIKIYCDLCQSVLPMFSSQNFIVSSLTFRFLIHFEIFFCMVLKNVKFSFLFFFLTCGCPVLPVPFIEESVFFPFISACLFYCRVIDHQYVMLFLDFLSCSIDLNFCFCASNILLWWP